MARQWEDALPAGFEFGGCRIERVLGAGGFGITYLATDLEFDRPVAVKEYLPAGLATRAEGTTVRPRNSDSAEDYAYGLERFREEGQTLTAFHHSNIVPVHRFLQANGTAYLVMGYVEGESLAKVLKRAGTLDESEIREVLDPILDGLEEVHRTGFLHRDIKPANIVIARTGRPVLIDFGAARLSVGGRTRTLTATVTPGYAPPEQYASRSRPTPAVDIYGIGATLYRAVTGQAPPDAPDRMMGEPMTPAADAAAGNYSPALLAAIDRALAVDAAERPQSVAELRALLAGVRADDTAETERASPPPAPPRRGRGGMWLTVAAVAAAVVAAGAWLALAPPDEPPAPEETAEAPETAAPETEADAPTPDEPEPETEPPAAPEPEAAAPDTPEPGPDTEPEAEVPAPPEPRQAFRDCPECPEMVVIPPGEFTMGSPPDEERRADYIWEGPQHRVRIDYPLAVGKYEVTFAQWDACVAAGGCGGHRPDSRWGRGDRPVIDMSWEDAQAYVEWLSERTGQRYRLLSESEWEYAARAGTTTARYWGEDIGSGHANCDGCGSRWDGEKTAPVGSFRPNGFGLHDMLGNVWEWTEDCWNDSYRGALADGRAWTSGDCSKRLLRGGSYTSGPRYVRSAHRVGDTASDRYFDYGFRVARTLD